MLYRTMLRFFAKREGKIHSNVDKQNYFVVFAVGFCMITQFLVTEALGKNNLADRRQSVGLSSICVSTFTNVSVAFKG